MSQPLKDPSIDFYKPFQSGEGTCYPLYPENYYRTQYTPMFGGKTRKHKGGKNSDVIYSNGVDLNLKVGGKRKSQKGGNLGVNEAFNMFGENSKNTLSEKFSNTNIGIPYATQAGGKKKSQKAGVNAAEYYTDSLTGSYSPKNIYSDEKVKTEKCGGNKKKSRSRSRSISKKRGGSKSRSRSVSKKRGGSKSRSVSKKRGGSKSRSRSVSKKRNNSKSRSNKKGGFADINDEAGRYNPSAGDDTLNRVGYQTAGGIDYRGASSPNSPSNFSDGSVFHPEWKYTKGGKKKSQKGGDNIPTPGAIPFGVATSEPAAAQVQMGLGEHIMKAPKDYVNSVLSNTGDIQTKAGELLRSLTGGSKRKQKGGNFIDTLMSNTRDFKSNITDMISSYLPKNNLISTSTQQDTKTLTGSFTKNSGDVSRTVSAQVQQTKNVAAPTSTTASSTTTPKPPTPTTQAPIVKPISTSNFQSGGKRRKQKAGSNLSACNFSSPSNPNKIPIPGAVPLEISASVSQGAQDQMYGDGFTRMRGPRDIVLPGTGDASSEAIQAQMGPFNGGKKKSRKYKGGASDSGGVGSDFALTLASRGPANYPDGPSADRFRFFNKSAEYIPNSMLKWAAAPISTGWMPDPNPYPQAYNDYCGGNKKNKKSKKVKKTKSRSRSRSRK